MPSRTCNPAETTHADLSASAGKQNASQIRTYFCNRRKFLHRHIFLFFAKTDRHAGASPATQHSSSLPLMFFQQRHNRHPSKKRIFSPATGKTAKLTVCP